MKKTTKPKISKTSKRRIDDFSDAAMYHGWQRDQGSGASVGIAAASFAESEAALVRRVAFLETQLNLFKHKFSMLSSAVNRMGVNRATKL